MKTSLFPGRALSFALGLVLVLVGCGKSFGESGAVSPGFSANPQPAPNGNAAPLFAARLADLSKGMSSTARQALEQLLRTKGIDGLSKMSEGDTRQTFGGMPASVRDEIRTNWRALSDEQRIALKNDIKEPAASQAKVIVRASAAPIMKQVETAAMDSKEVVSKATSILSKFRAYTQRLIAKLTGSTHPMDETIEGSAPPEKN